MKLHVIIFSTLLALSGCDNKEQSVVFTNSTIELFCTADDPCLIIHVDDSGRPIENSGISKMIGVHIVQVMGVHSEPTGPSKP